MSLRRILLTLTLVGSIVAALGSLLAALGLGMLLIVGSDAVEMGGLLLGTLALAAGVVVPALGILTAWQASRALSGRSGAAFRLPGWGWLLLALIIVLAFGQALFTLSIEPPVAVIHITAATLAALFMLAIPVGAARRHGWTLSGRVGVGSLAWGALGGVGLAIVVELMLLVLVVLLALAAFNATDPTFVQRLARALEGMSRPGGDVPVDALTPYLRSPLVLFGGLLVAAFIVPLIEEIAKSLAIPLLFGMGRRSTSLDAFLLGAAAGAGFTLIEGITNGATALSQPGGWATAMTARSGVAVIHVLASALAGLAWHAGLIRRDWGKALGYFAAAVAVHGSWNGGALIVAWLSLVVGSGTFSPALVAGNLAVLAVVAMLGAVFLGSLVLLAVLPGRLAARDAEYATDRNQ